MMEGGHLKVLQRIVQCEFLPSRVLVNGHD